MFDDAVIREAGRRILRAAPPGSRVILFGSYARGQAGEHSDLDFLVIEPEVEDIVKESIRLRRTLNGLEVWADVIVRSEESVREWRDDVYGTVINSALREGRELAASWPQTATLPAGSSPPPTSATDPKPRSVSTATRR